ncbi:MAG: phosphate/phosphite/phosphonate ABC transporter substrate-binding protein [SAR324 cluster bacterium]|nr:phosphate/phosphite/phosphonate ABC transporter substrate-binding protein [SAR324 cluster bacterium]
MKTPVFYLPVLLILIACDSRSRSDYNPTYSDQSPLKTTKLIFAVHPLHNPARLFEDFSPLIKFLNEQIPEVTISLEASKDYATFDQRLNAKKYHLALPNPYQTIQALQNGYHVFGKMGDDFNFRGIILTRKDANIRQVTDLKGKTVSYPAPTALAATMMPQYFLWENGLNIQQDITNAYVGSQESSIMNVLLKNSDAAATWPIPWMAFQRKFPDKAAELVVSWETSPLINNGLVFREDVPLDVVQKMGNLMFHLQDHEAGRAILHPMEISQFEAATDESYQIVHDFLQNFSTHVRPLD